MVCNRMYPVSGINQRRAKVELVLSGYKVPAGVSACIVLYIYTYIHTYMHTFTHTYTCTERDSHASDGDGVITTALSRTRPILTREMEQR